MIAGRGGGEYREDGWGRNEKKITEGHATENLSYPQGVPDLTSLIWRFEALTNELRKQRV